MKKKQGFTLIELVVVIVVLGLLAVAALPRFVDVTDQAKEASIEGVAGGFATAVLSARAQWEGEGRPTVSNEYVVDYDGQEFWLTDSADSDNDTDFRDGYPIAAKGTNAGQGFPGSMVTAVTNAICVALMEELLQNPPSVDTSNTNEPQYVASAIVSNGDVICRYTQQQGKNHFFDYDVTRGSVAVTLAD